MENTTYIGLSKQIALRTNMSIIANNVANVNTSGYRAQNLIFDEFISDPRGGDDDLSFVNQYGQFQVTQEGPVTQTSNPLDIALIGPGFIGVVGPLGEVAYSRAGSFAIDGNGTLVTDAGFPVANQGGGQIEIPQGSTEIKIDRNGVISNQDGEIDQIGLHEFENIQLMEPFGNNLYTTEEAPIEAENTVVQQYHVEGSNVQPVLEMTRMIDTLRDYQGLSRFLQGENDRLRNAVRTLTGQS